MLICCNQKIKSGELWILKDIKGFTSRKLYKAICPICGDDVVLLIEKRTTDNKLFFNNLNKIEAVKTIYREKKRRLTVVPAIEHDNLYGWIYGVNKEIKNKKKETTQIRQYSSDFHGNRVLTKRILQA